MEIREVGRFEGEPVREIVLCNALGAKANILTWGAVVRDLIMPTRSGPRSVVLGFDSFDPYPVHSRNFGAIIGRFANRIADGRFSLDGHVYQLTRNDGGVHHLHGGAGAFGDVVSVADAPDAGGAAFAAPYDDEVLLDQIIHGACDFVGQALQ